MVVEGVAVTAYFSRMERRLLAIHAHPDDEASKGAGTVARYVDDGVRAVLVTATGGEAGEVLNPALDTPEVRRDLAEHRRRELREAADIIGYAEVVLLGYRDSGMPGSPDNARPDALVNADPDEVLRRLVAVVRRFRPHVVLGYDRHDRYPHPDHLAIHRFSLELFEAAADPERFPEAGEPWEIAKLYAPIFSARRIHALHDAMVARGMSSPFARWIEGLPPDADEGVRITRVYVGDHLERARRALAAHRTQVDPNGFWFQVPLDLVREVHPYEDFELLGTRVGWREGETDLFEGVSAGVAS